MDNTGDEIEVSKPFRAPVGKMEETDIPVEQFYDAIAAENDSDQSSSSAAVDDSQESQAQQKLVESIGLDTVTLLKANKSLTDEVESLKTKLDAVKNDQMEQQRRTESRLRDFDDLFYLFVALINFLVNAATKNPFVSTILNLGTFENEQALDIFLEELKSLEGQLQFNSPEERRSVLEKVEGMLNAAETVSANVQEQDVELNVDKDGNIDWNTPNPLENANQILVPSTSASTPPGGNGQVDNQTRGRPQKTEKKNVKGHSQKRQGNNNFNGGTTNNGGSRLQKPRSLLRKRGPKAKSDKENEALRRQLETEKEDRRHTESQMLEFVSYFLSEIAEILQTVVFWTEKSPTVNILNFEDEEKAEEFREVLQGFCEQFTKLSMDFENKDSDADKVKLILTPVTYFSAEWEKLRDDLDAHDSACFAAGEVDPPETVPPISGSSISLTTQLGGNGEVQKRGRGRPKTIEAEKKMMKGPNGKRQGINKSIDRKNKPSRKSVMTNEEMETIFNGVGSVAIQERDTEENLNDPPSTSYPNPAHSSSHLFGENCVVKRPAKLPRKRAKNEDNKRRRGMVTVPNSRNEGTSQKSDDERPPILTRQVPFPDAIESSPIPNDEAHSNDQM